MLVEFDEGLPAQLDVAPIAVGGDQFLAVGGLAQVAGFGPTESSGPGLRRFLVEEITKLDDDLITIDGRGRSGLCATDSGGPLLVRGDGGRVLAAGILRGGSADCLGEDDFTRLGSADERWIASYTGTGDATETPDAHPCVALGLGGRCFESSAVWCQDGAVHGTACEAGMTCGWSAGAVGFRCVLPPDDPCDGVSDLGQCSSGQLRRCDHGRLVEMTCSSCVRSPMSGAVTCAD